MLKDWDNPLDVHYSKVAIAAVAAAMRYQGQDDDDTPHYEQQETDSSHQTPSPKVVRRCFD